MDQIVDGCNKGCVQFFRTGCLMFGPFIKSIPYINVLNRQKSPAMSVILLKVYTILMDLY